MNNLGRDIQKGEVVIIDKTYIKPMFHNDRRFEVSGGFGLAKMTAGTALFGKWLSDGEECRLEGDWINAEETNIYQTTGQF